LTELQGYGRRLRDLGVPELPVDRPLAIEGKKPAWAIAQEIMSREKLIWHFFLGFKVKLMAQRVLAAGIEIALVDRLGKVCNI
jgi:hypothetical protein